MKLNRVTAENNERGGLPIADFTIGNLQSAGSKIVVTADKKTGRLRIVDLAIDIPAGEQNNAIAEMNKNNQ